MPLGKQDWESMADGENTGLGDQKSSFLPNLFVTVANHPLLCFSHLCTLLLYRVLIKDKITCLETLFRRGDICIPNVTNHRNLDSKILPKNLCQKARRV